MRMGNREAYQRALQRMIDPQEPQKVRLTFLTAVGQAARGDALAHLNDLLAESQPPAVRMAALVALEHYPADAVADEVLGHYKQFTPDLQNRAIALAISRLAWSQTLVEQVAAEKIDAADVSVDQIRRMLAHGDPALERAIEARWGKIRPAIPGEKMSYVPVLGRVLKAGKGNLESGHKLYMKHCGTCHLLHGEGEKIGPDLTTADRKNRDALLINILDPSGTIRPEFVSQTALLSDGRVLTGLVIESSAQQITFVDAKQQKTTVARDEIDQLHPSETSLMPERLLETLQPQEIRDLFSYLESDRPAVQSARKK